MDERGENSLKLTDFSKYRLKRFLSNKDPVEMISDLLVGLNEQLMDNINKRWKPEVIPNFNCDLIHFEDDIKGKKTIVNLINPQININVSINKQPSFNNLNHNVSNNNVNVIIKEEDIKNKIGNSTNLFQNIENKSVNIGLTNQNNSLLNNSNIQQKKPEIKELPLPKNDLAKPNQTNQLNSNILIPNKNNNNEEIQNKINSSKYPVISSQNAGNVSNIMNNVPGIIQEKSLQKKMIAMSENYVNIKSEVDKINKNQGHKKNINEITDNINIRFNQISTDESIQPLINEILSILQKLERANNDDLYIYTIDYICKRIITKTEGYNNDKKINIYRLSNLSAILDQSISIFGDFFVSILTYRCPFIIPKIYLKKDFKSEEEYSKKMGFAYATQTAVEHLSDMEAHAYLFFGFIQNDKNKRYSKYVEHFTKSVFTEAPIYPMAAVTNAFLDTFGSSFKQNYSILFEDFSKKISDYLKLLEGVKNNLKSSDIKSKVSTCIHFIKKNLDSIKKNQPTAMFKV